MAYAEVADLQNLLPDIGDVRAQQLLDLASDAVDANTHKTIPADPVPVRVKLATLAQAARLAQVDPTGANVTGESIEGFNHQLNNTRAEYALTIPAHIKAMLAPWRNTIRAADTLEGEYEARIAYDEAVDGGGWVPNP